MNLENIAAKLARHVTFFVGSKAAGYAHAGRAVQGLYGGSLHRPLQLGVPRFNYNFRLRFRIRAIAGAEACECRHCCRDEEERLRERVFHLKGEYYKNECSFRKRAKKL